MPPKRGAPPTGQVKEESMALSVAKVLIRWRQVGIKEVVASTKAMAPPLDAVAKKAKTADVNTLASLATLLESGAREKG
jgi:hypothetical protein